MSILTDFLGKNRELLAGLQGQVEALRGRPKNPEGYSRLVISMEAYRDFVRDFLDSLPERKRAKIENYLYPAIFPLVEAARKLAVEAYEIGVIPENLAHVTGLLGNSMLFVVTQSALMV